MPIPVAYHRTFARLVAVLCSIFLASGCSKTKNPLRPATTRETTDRDVIVEPKPAEIGTETAEEFGDKWFAIVYKHFDGRRYTESEIARLLGPPNQILGNPMGVHILIFQRRSGDGLKIIEFCV